MSDTKQCYFCTSNIKSINYKDAEVLKRFLSPQSKILPKRKTSVCAKHQRKMAQAVKRARVLGLVPFMTS
ncbi:MAG: 30S ribosomal protein S18 [Candidatus Niyogibacteria bacterium CG10_big_fil_rev_8_21_14_0_10_42_19]|uniref:Small ribosomal subunit protein bS18 n=1 Tax=Candidatus Niyogibacteria bacterium CG10_big_fil_rev_8_21_14_0_10_42_19 TaxID=1974725 RepID=A0A2H0THD3_9BACT|nr:MAG: 30S ribosomal protein S18 [Candidatus Niyogibacteria bacterium CG10_big_fil_rev_8_21_14_0_10_42_19]